MRICEFVSGLTENDGLEFDIVGQEGGGAVVLAIGPVTREIAKCEPETWQSVLAYSESSPGILLNRGTNWRITVTGTTGQGTVKLSRVAPLAPT